jgi:hypothetical protein
MALGDLRAATARGRRGMDRLESMCWLPRGDLSEILSDSHGHEQRPRRVYTDLR